MKSGNYSGPETHPEADDIEQIFERSRPEEKANWADFKPTLDRLQANAGTAPLTRTRLFSWPRLVMAGMTAVIALLVISLVAVTLLTPKEATQTVVANQPAQTAVIPTAIPPITAQPVTTAAAPAQVDQPTSAPSPTIAAATTAPGTTVAAALATANVQPTSVPTSQAAQTQATSKASSPATQVNNANPTATTSINTPLTPSVPTKLAIETPIGAVTTSQTGKSGKPVTIFGTLVSVSGSGASATLTVKTTEGVILVNVTSATNFGSPGGANDVASLPAGTSLSATGPINSQGQLEATLLTLNPQGRSPLGTPGYPDDTK